MIGKLFPIFIANVFFSLPSLFLVVAYSHFGSLNDSAVLGISFAICAPVQLFFSMQHGVSILAGKLDYRFSFLTRLSMVAPFLIVGCIFSVYFSTAVVLLFFLARVTDYLYEPFLYEKFRGDTSFGVAVETGGRFLGILLIVSLSVYYDFGLLWSLVGISIFSAFFVLARLPGAIPWGEKKWGVGVGLYTGLVPLVSSVLVNIPRYFLFGKEDALIAFYSNMLTLVLGGSLVYGAFNNFYLSKCMAQGGGGGVKFLDGTVCVFFMGLLASLGFYFFEGVMSLEFVRLFLGSKYIGYYDLVFGFAVFYFILYLHSALNCIFVCMGLERIYFSILILYFLSLLFGCLFLFGGNVGSLVWGVNFIGFVFGALCFVFLRAKLKERVLK